jgi:hypothetical protein
MWCPQKFIQNEADKLRTRTFSSIARDLRKGGAHNFESGGRGFESLRAHHSRLKSVAQALRLHARLVLADETPVLSPVMKSRDNLSIVKVEPLD